ncbi:hypothetical protein [Flavobacterium hungaricum]|uniref:SUKH-4 immunity protein n=1 Tax=Flavobacterium hungaricum TaxID=2082725 RepID=A0ABR9TF59_9FLAO|nr:hypothetical protein [Flavobacterium hungaricum]MBE8723986.1 hypothetical protein [Flavobacterium hungaricum]
MVLENKIIEHFGSCLVKREIDTSLMQILTEEEIYLLSKIGLPNNCQDFEFTNSLVLLTTSELLIGNTAYNDPVILNLESRKIFRGSDFFLAQSLKNFVCQLYVLDTLWKIDIPQQKLGDYRENHNHKKYAAVLETKLLDIDPDLLKNDLGYFWGSLIEDIESGIVG